MKNYNNYNYKRYKDDIKASQPEGKFWDEYTRDELIIKFLPLVENIARKFSTSDSASGIMNIQDLMSMGKIGLIQAVDKIQWKQILESSDPEKTIKSYLAKRVRGAIRRGTDANRSPMRIPEHKLNDIRKGFEDDPEKQAMFYNSMFQSIDQEVEDDMLPQYEDESENPMKKEILFQQLNTLMLKYLTDKEYHVIRLSYGLGCNKQSAKQIAKYLNIGGISSYVRVSQLKKQAVDKLKANVKHSQVVDYL
jgi:RNA polymerase sigma factor (sigma-70 family)|tara:strand:- start:64 stop:813 length:750 start_codon:yes stop_codon:yes gene_type:complete